MLTIMAICHDVMITFEDGKIKLSGASPDEIAFISFCRHCGIEV